MGRRVRKVVLYVVVADGSVHSTRQEAYKRAAAATPNRMHKRKTSGPSYVELVMRSIREGARTVDEVRKRQPGIPRRMLHPTVANLRKRGLVKGYGVEKSLRLTRSGNAHLDTLRYRRAEA